MNFLIILATLLAISRAANGIGENKARYDNYRIYKVKLETDEHVKLFHDIEMGSDSYQFMGHARQINQELVILAAAHKIGELTDHLKTHKVEHTILTQNFQAKIDAEAKHVKPADVPISEFGWENYYHLETIYGWLESLAEKYRGVITPLNAGMSYEGVPMKGVKLSHKANNSAIFIEAGIHAREWISPATATFILNQLLTSNDTKVQDVAQNFDWYFFPIVNPDGYKATFESDRMWRKTRQPFGICRGTDMNRNWDTHWNETGASPDPCRFDFAGPNVFSEPEAKQLSDFVLNLAKTQNVRTYISLHSFSQLLMFPYASTSEKAPNYDDLKAIGVKAITALKQRYGTVYKTGSVHETIYPSSGSSHDWAYSKANIPLAYTFELRGPPGSTDMFILPAEQISPTGWETLDAFVALVNEARVRGYYDANETAASQRGSASIKHISLMNLILAFSIYRLFAN